MELDINLATIMVLPEFQGLGYGKFLISMSYYLSADIEDKLGTPERPLSKQGATSFLSFWKEKIFQCLRNYKANYDVTIREIVEETNL